jgi:hypothetical protein
MDIYENKYSLVLLFINHIYIYIYLWCYDIIDTVILSMKRSKLKTDLVYCLNE